MKKNTFIQIYRNILYPAVKLSFHLMATKNKKIQEGIKMREPTQGHYPWLNFETNTHPIWIHCASGEFEYAKPVIREIKNKYPLQKILVTYFSPSVKKSVENCKEVDFSTPSPWDDPYYLQEFILHHKPKALLVSRTDIWPEMLTQAKKFKIPTVLFSATLSSANKRMYNQITRRFSAVLMQMFDSIYCVTQDDYDNFKKLGLEKKCKIIGDTRFDQVLYRLNQEEKELKNIFLNKKCIVFGSTWEEDEQVILPALKGLLRNQICIIIAPHEPTKKHIEKLCTKIHDLGLKSSLYTSIQTSGASSHWGHDQILIIDQVGILADLYKKSYFAFVGGSFKKTVHSVMEPLAAGNLTMVGPYHHNNREAIEFSQKFISKTEFHPVQVVHSSADIEKYIQKCCQQNLEFFREEIIELIKEKTGVSKNLVLNLEKENIFL